MKYFVNLVNDTGHKATIIQHHDDGDLRYVKRYT